VSPRAAAKPLAGLVLGGEPRVNLIPPEVGERARRRRTRSYLVVAVVAAVALVLAAYAAATVRSLAVHQILEAEKTRTTQLLEQRAAYADTIAVTQAVGIIELTREQATSTEVIWADILDKITAQLGTSTYAEWSAQAPAPWVAPLATSTPLAKPLVATMTLTVRSASPIDTSALYRRLLELDATADMNYTFLEQPDGELLYLATMTINLDADALAGRFPHDGADAADTTTDTTDTTDTTTQESTDEGK
jgi:hypothetical protein